MDSHKSVLTTGEVAKICSVAPRTVSKWFDSGQLRGYRIPGSKDRRIPLEHLIRFMRAHGIPLNGLESGRRRVLVFDADATMCETLRDTLAGDGGYEVAIATTALEAGAAAQEFKPQVFVADVALPDATPQTISRFVRSNPDLHAALLIGIGAGITEGRGQALLQDGFAAYLNKPFQVGSLVRIIEQTASLVPLQASL